MVNITSADAFLFYAAVLIGLSIGVIGNFWVTCFFRWFDDLIVKHEWDKECINWWLFIIFSVILLITTWILYSYFQTMLSSP